MILEGIRKRRFSTLSNGHYPADISQVISDKETDIVLVPFPTEAIILFQKGLWERSVPEKHLIGFFDFRPGNLRNFFFEGFITASSGSRLMYVGDIQTIGVGQIGVVPRHLPTSQSSLSRDDGLNRSAVALNPLSKKS
ncbi:MAG: hypothetical protein GY846_08395 [Deltaproteobacteria bacterium]|nr:hypothetical protein [Deltaproteobacteria bacterium]